MVSIIALWVLVLFETGLLLLLLRALGKIRQQGLPSTYSGPDIAGLNIGEQAPTFVAVDPDGNPIRLQDFSTQRRIIAFVMPGCSSCAGAIEALNILVRDKQGLTVLVIGGPDRELNRAYAIEYKAKMPILTPNVDLAGTVYRVQGVPFIFVLDETGMIRAKGVVNRRDHLQSLLSAAFAAESSSLNALN